MPEQLDLNLLRVFDALLQDGSVTAAAERLHLSIPAASRALARLRRAMDDPILVRAGRGLAPTPFALRIAPRVRSLLDEAQALVNDKDVDVAELRRTFTIRVGDGVVTSLVGVVADQAPHVVLRFVAEGDESVEALRDGSVDLDLGAGTDTDSDIRSEVLFGERMVGVVRTDHPLKKPTLKQLCRYPHVSVSRRGRAHGPLDVALQARGLQRHVGAVVPFNAAAAMLVASTDYIGLFPQRLAEEHHRVLRWFPIDADLPEAEVRMHWHARLDADPAQRWLRDMVRRTVKVLAPHRLPAR
ncbi:LysR family transcriptional regulator [Lentzea aerocolonigenes]|uniref:LysR family transcriptional regulator n=1 Tax=Lentzea aerocolonigenes TaxID=68170 RepID=A0A0F0GKV8_LENAE|nr:LysR family transcriptional regulator [Lentzea aerocolonigenes]KJK42607.1 LysR family transcriptional regulator [Lentzea aerocolonigenes]